MEMLLMGAVLSMFGLAVTCLAFGAAARGEKRPEPAEGVKAAVPATRFFVSPPATQPRVPIEALLLQIENHVRLEQAAAECFLESPNAALLHSRTISPLVN
ncbi:MAG TPA: hypothetical protein VMH28_00835 [Candidatus Acidoferrales bacterium]|nr:hypothetical protein [Candidatus Acidoferrales bacterium]